jgi:hypothetical protein
MAGRGSSPFGAAAFSRPTYFPRNDETAFRLQAAASKVTGLPASGSNSTPAFRPSVPDHSRSSAATADRLFFDIARAIQPAGASNLDAHIRQARKISATDADRDAPGAAASLAADERRHDRRSPTCPGTAPQVPARRGWPASRSCREECGLRF